MDHHRTVAGVIGARNSAALRASLRQLDGGLSEVLRKVRRELIGMLAPIEATVYFSDEDVEPVQWGEIERGLGAVRDDLRRLLQTAFVGRILESGVRTAIVGRPNVGKSSLLNGLLMRERAIVSDLPGTTRDTVEELVEIGGVPVHLVDTAGLRGDGDVVEQLGVRRSVRAMEEADLVLFVVDASAGLNDDELRLLAGLQGGGVIVVANKTDLWTETADWPEPVCEAWQRLSSRVREVKGRAARVCGVSALTGAGLDDLRATIQAVATGEAGLHLEEPILASERQRNLVAEATARTEAALVGAGGRLGEELVCEDLRGAISAVGRVTGEELVPDLLDEIFSRFCLGK